MKWELGTGGGWKLPSPMIIDTHLSLDTLSNSPPQITIHLSVDHFLGKIHFCWMRMKSSRGFPCLFVQMIYPHHGKSVN